MLHRMVKAVMTLLKKESVRYIHILRPILLVEVEVQAISSSQWAKTISRSAERHKIITKSQYGARKGRQGMKERCTGMQLRVPDGMLEVNKIMDLYIDDSAQCCNRSSEGKSLLQQTGFNLQYHAHLVYATGGALALDKCKHYNIRHSFVNGLPRILNTPEFESSLLVQNDLHSPRALVRLINFNDPHKTLGCFVPPSGNQSDTIKQLMMLARNWVNRIQQSTLKDFEVLLAYESVLMRQWVYRLLSSRLTFEERDKIMKITSPTLLHAMHSQKNV